MRRRSGIDGEVMVSGSAAGTWLIGAPVHKLAHVPILHLLTMKIQNKYFRASENFETWGSETSYPYACISAKNLIKIRFH
jgi:hypothetical protein